MPSIEELLNEAELHIAAQPVNDVLEIDPETREISIPDSEIIFGVENDQKAERKYFHCPKIVGNNINLSELVLYVVFQNAGGESEENRDKYLVTDVESTSDGYVTFSWELSKKVTAYRGEVMFSVCATKTNSKGTVLNVWNTTVAKGKCLVGIFYDLPEEEKTNVSDFYQQLMVELNKETESKKQEVIEAINDVKASIPDDYAELSNTVENIKDAVLVKTQGTNLDDYTTAGVYYFDSGYKPVGIPVGSNGWLIVLNNKNSKAYKQIWLRAGTADSNDHHSYIRTYIGSKWSSWNKVVIQKELEALLSNKVGTSDVLLYNDKTIADNPLYTDFNTVPWNTVVSYNSAVVESLKNYPVDRNGVFSHGVLITFSYGGNLDLNGQLFLFFTGGIASRMYYKSATTERWSEWSRESDFTKKKISELNPILPTGFYVNVKNYQDEDKQVYMNFNTVPWNTIVTYSSNIPVEVANKPKVRAGLHTHGTLFTYTFELTKPSAIAGAQIFMFIDGTMAIRHSYNNVWYPWRYLEESDNEYHSVYYGKKVSILGDSISTYKGYIPDGNKVYYTGSNCGVSSVAQTWWYRSLIKGLGMELLVNNSWSGRCVTNVYDATTGMINSGGCNEEQIDALATGGVNPDVIIIRLGINDLTHGFSLGMTMGDYNGHGVIPSSTDANKKKFREAYAIMLGYIAKKYPDAEVWCCTCTNVHRNPVFPCLYKGYSISDLNSVIVEMADLFGYKVLRHNRCGLNYYSGSDYFGDWAGNTDDVTDGDEAGTHPNALGHKLISDQTLLEMGGGMHQRYITN